MSEDNATKQYTVLTDLRHNGTEYKRGEFVELTEEQAAPLTEGKNPTVKEGKYQLGDRLVEDEEPRSNEPEAGERVTGDTDANEIESAGGDTPQTGDTDANEIESAGGDTPQTEQNDSDNPGQIDDDEADRV